SRYMEFLKIAIEHPTLDLYSVTNADWAALSQDERRKEEQKVQQKLAYTLLTDVFEVAYVQYKESRGIPSELKQERFNAQWPGWDAYIRKFLARPRYRDVWFDIRNEYDTNFVNYMDKIAPPPIPAPGEGTLVR